LSKENINKFQEELQRNAELKDKLEGLKLSYEELVSFAKEAGLDVTLEELKESNSKPAVKELPIDELDQVVGGLTYDDGHWMTTAGFSCGKWEASQNQWQAGEGRCSSCKHWTMMGTLFGKCAVNVEQL
jgi:predicted ribosomally synthesized peptide with nif11-like leader